jgi:hypothetical protein
MILNYALVLLSSYAYSFDQLPINSVIWIDSNECPPGWIKYEKISERVPVGSSNEMAVGTIGGQTNTQLTEANIPSHFHYAFSTGGRGGRINYNPGLYAMTGAGVSWGGMVNENFEYEIQGSTGVANTGKTSSVGTASSFSNMPPYLVLLACIKASNESNPFAEYDVRMSNVSEMIVFLELALAKQEVAADIMRVNLTQKLTERETIMVAKIKLLESQLMAQSELVEIARANISKDLAELYSELNAVVARIALLELQFAPTPAPTTAMPTVSMSPTRESVETPASIVTKIKYHIRDIEFMSRLLLGGFFTANVGLGVYWKAELRRLDGSYISKMSILGLALSYVDLWLDVEMCVYLHESGHDYFSLAMVAFVVLPILASSCICFYLYLFYNDTVQGEGGEVDVKGDPESSTFYDSKYLPLKLMACTNLDLLVLLPWEYGRFESTGRLRHFADNPTEFIVKLSLWRYFEDGPQIVIQFMFIWMNGYNSLAATSLAFSCLTMLLGLLRKLEQIFRSKNIRRRGAVLPEGVPVNFGKPPSSANADEDKDRAGADDFV